MHIIVLASIEGSFCAAEQGEPLRSVINDVNTDGVHAYLIGGKSHRAAHKGLVVDVPMSREQVQQALVNSVCRAFGEVLRGDPEIQEEIAELLDIAQQHPEGTEVTALLDGLGALTPSPQTRRQVFELREATTTFLQDLLQTNKESSMLFPH